MRLAAAIMLLGAGVAGALWEASYRVTHTHSACAVPLIAGACPKPGGYGSGGLATTTYTSIYETQPSWVIPAAILIGFLGLALSALIYRATRTPTRTTPGTP